jgi:hypothetical protein
MGYVPDATVAALKGNYNLGIFFRLGTTPALHLAFGVNDVPITVPVLDSVGTIYQGAGRFLDIPTLEVLINGIADKVTFSLYGIDPSVAALVLDSTPEVLGALVTIGIAPLDARWQPLSQIIGLWSGTADFIAEEMKPESDPTKSRVQSIMLTTSSGDTSRALPNLITYSDATQKTLYPTDRFFERTVRYIQGYLVSWPRF